MKIGEVKIGTEYGAVDSPRGGRFTRTGDPRQVRVLEIVSVEEKLYSGYGRASTRNVRRVKVEVLDVGPGRKSSWRNERIAYADKGESLVIEARQLVAPWSELHDGIIERRNAEQARREGENQLNARIQAITGKKSEWSNWRTSVRGQETEATFSGKTLDTLLSLAEAGKAAKS